MVSEAVKDGFFYYFFVCFCWVFSGGDVCVNDDTVHLYYLLSVENY